MLQVSGAQVRSVADIPTHGVCQRTDTDSCESASSTLAYLAESLVAGSVPDGRQAQGGYALKQNPTMFELPDALRLLARIQFAFTVAGPQGRDLMAFWWPHRLALSVPGLYCSRVRCCNAQTAQRLAHTLNTHARPTGVVAALQELR